MFYRNQISKLIRIGLLIIAATMLLTGCTKDDEFQDKIVDFAIVPEEADIGVGESVDFSVVAETAAGEEIPVPPSYTTEWISSDTSVFQVNAKGIATGQKEGTAFCVFEASGDNEVIRRRFVGRDSAFVSIFR